MMCGFYVFIVEAETYVGAGGMIAACSFAQKRVMSDPPLQGGNGSALKGTGSAPRTPCAINAAAVGLKRPAGLHSGNI